MENPQNPAAFKSQPWDLFDTITARSFLMGDTVNGKAAGSEVPAISANGEIVFFQSSGRTRANMPWYTNLDVPGQLAYGFQVWQISISVIMPAMVGNQSNNNPGVGDDGVSPVVRLSEALLNYSVLQLNLGQEDQIEWPTSRFPAGGGLSLAVASADDASFQSVNNGVSMASNVLSLPEPIEMGRTQNLSAKIRLAPEVFPLIGSIAAPGVGLALLPYKYTIPQDEVPVVVDLPMPQFAIQLNLKGRRVKQTQYGQLVR